MMRVRYYHQIPGLGYGNILWAGKFEMRAGKFPANHPCAPGDAGTGRAHDFQFGVSASLDAFRVRDYWASCFPEGDGITMKSPDGVTAAKVAQDIKECFGWDVVVMRDENGKEGET